MTTRRSALLALALTAALLLAACTGASTAQPSPQDAAGPAGSDPQHADEGSTSVPRADLVGAQVTVRGPASRGEAEAINAVIDRTFNEAYGARARYEGSGTFEQDLPRDIAAGDPPDVALYPQPGAVLEQAAAGNLVALDDLGFDLDALREVFGDALLDLGAYEGRYYGLPTNASLKSLIWYHLPTFEVRGYQVPATWEELVALSERMLADGSTPWCLGTGSDAATGWPATDWLEDIVLRDAGPAIYDGWVAGEVTFDDPPILAAAERMAEITHREGFVLGGTEAVPDTDYRDAPLPLFDDPPGCLLHRQASFIVSFFPDDVVIGEDVEVFAFPTIDGADGALIAGELAVAFNDRPEVAAFLEVFSGREAQCAQGSFAGVARISPNMETSADCYRDPVVALSAETLLTALEAGTARFDASDLMPPTVGSGSFWSGMNAWMRGAELEEVLADIAASWPQ